MPLLGSFCLLFALALAAYSFVVGIIAALRRDAVGARLAETARRAGMATFVAVLGAAVALVWAALANDFSVAYIYGHTHNWKVESDTSGIHLINLPPVSYVFREGEPSGWVTKETSTAP